MFRTGSSGGAAAVVAAVVCLVSAAVRPACAEGPLRHETITLTEEEPATTVTLLFRDAPLERRPVILMLGALRENEPPDWSVDLLREGYLLAAFTAHHPPDPDPARRAQWLYFDQRFAHSYVLGGSRAPRDAGRVMDALAQRSDVDSEKFGWLGSSSTGILGLAVAAREPRLRAIVGFVSTGAYEQWLASWRENGLWQGETEELWPETLALFDHDPIRHVNTLYPTAVLLVSGGADKVVDPRTTTAFVQAARPFYDGDPDRLQHVIYDGVGHNLPRNVVKLFAEHWFHVYLHPVNPPPAPRQAAGDLPESVRRTQINAADHKEVIGGRE